VKLPLDVVISVLTAATMLAVGLELDTRRIPEILPEKLPLPGLLLGQLLLLPALAMLVVWIVPMPESTRFVVLMLAACPTGNIANFFTLLARGDLALSVLASAISCLLAPVSMTLTFSIYRGLLGAGFPFTLPAGTLLIRIFALTWAPIFLGLALRSVRSRGMARFSTALRNACATGTVVLCVFICVTQARQLAIDWKTNVTVSAMLVLGALSLAMAISRALRLAVDDAISYATSLPARHIGVLAAVTVTTLHRFDNLVLILVYFVVEATVILAVVAAYRWRSSAQAISA
jgi:bile acid:Na+ symporter, BASS family